MTRYEAAKQAVEKKTAPLREQLAALESPYRRKLAEAKHAMLTADERAVMAIAEKDRTPAQKRLIQGLQTSLRVTWEDVAAAVARNAADHDEAGVAEAGDRRAGTDTAPAPCTRDGARGREAGRAGDVRAAAGRLSQHGAEGEPSAARRDPGLADGQGVRAGVDCCRGQGRRGAGRPWRGGWPGPTIRWWRG